MHAVRDPPSNSAASAPSKPVEPLAQAELSPGAAGVEAVVAGTSFLLSEEARAHPA
jgi:hypothetical protein